MIQIVLRMDTAPRQTADTVRAFRSLKREVLSIRGLVFSHVYLDAEVADSLCYVEEWGAPEDLGQDEATVHFTRLFGLIEKSAHPPVLCVNSVGSTHGLEQLSALTRPGRGGDTGCGEVRSE